MQHLNTENIKYLITARFFAPAKQSITDRQVTLCFAGTTKNSYLKNYLKVNNSIFWLSLFLKVYNYKSTDNLLIFRDNF